MRAVAVLAGGLGTRVTHLADLETPKALLPVAGHPFIDYKLMQLAHMGFTDALLLTGHAAPALRDHVGTGRRYGLAVECLDDGSAPLGTGGAVIGALPCLPEQFWVTYGDSLVEADPPSVEDALHDGLLGMMTVLENADRWAPSNADVDGRLVVRYSKGAPPGTLRWIDYGLLLFRRAAFVDYPLEAIDLSDIVQSLVSERRLGAFPVSQRFHEIGSEEAWRETNSWAARTNLWAGLTLDVAKRRRGGPQPP
jgi:NDP-sugar pyrophosphorylase family protein